MSSYDFKIAVLISGGGTTLRNLLDYRQRGELNADIAHVISSNPNAGGLEFAKAANIPFSIFNFREFPDPAAMSERVFDCCRNAAVNLAVLGGFLRKLEIPDDFVNRVINIHPSLIPNFCGKGFYGQRVHQAVIESGIDHSGCTVHFVDNQFDHGPIILQEQVPVLDGDSPETLAARVFEAECRVYPTVINKIAAERVDAI